MNRERSLGSLQHIFVETDRRFGRTRAVVAAVLLAIAAGLAVGAYVALLSPVLALAGVMALAGGLLMLRDTQWGLVALIGLICLLPFGALPFKIGFTPTFLDLVLIALYLVWILRIVTGRSGRFVATPLGLPIVIFLLLACASFVAGLAHTSPTSYILRHFVELLLSIALFFVIVNNVQTRARLRTLIGVLLLAGAAAAFVGIVLYVLPDNWSIQLLSALGRVGYPTGPGVLRYVEDDPGLAMRAISTSTDPNVLGGLLILVSTLTTAQLFARRPLFRRPLLAAMAGVDVLCLYLTYSRGSMAGFAVGLAALALIRYRRLIPGMIIAAALLLLLPQAQAYVQHFVEGLQLQDLATLMRLGEYKDALALIGRHPWIGVGFAGTPEISLYIGVSNVYLLIAEEMGLLGLSVFGLIVGLFFRQVWLAWPRVRGQEGLEAILLGLATALVGILAGGMLDHYFFNLDFPHSISIFWIFMGLAMAAVRLGTAEAGEEAEAEAGTSFALWLPFGLSR